MRPTRRVLETASVTLSHVEMGSGDDRLCLLHGLGVLEGIGHGLHVEAPTAVPDTLRTFLTVPGNRRPATRLSEPPRREEPARRY